MNDQNNSNFTLSEIHDLLKTLDKYSDNEIIQTILSEVFDK
jgi:D-alanyl-D-alanine carboxypeptidase